MRSGIEKYIVAALVLFIVPFNLAFAETVAAANQTIPFLVAEPSNGAVSYSLSVKILAVMTILTVIPALLITMSAFTRIVIVLAIVRQAIGIPSVPSNQILMGLTLIMTLFVMMPSIEKINENNIQPYLQGKMNEMQALEGASIIIKSFMMKQTRKTDLKVFADLSRTKLTDNKDYPLLVLMPAFITSELKTAFEIGFLIFMPFLIIDLVVASILMSMGMMMLSPMVISLPFKILFFVLVDGWSLIVTSLITSFRF